MDNISTTSPGVRIAYLSEKNSEVIKVKIRLKSAVTIGVENYPAGSEVELLPEQAEVLIQLGLAEKVEEKPQKEGKKK